MRNCYIHSAVSISAQNTFDTDSFLAEIITHHENKIQAIYPNYREYISPSVSRRMETGVKIGFVAATKALTLAQLSQPDAILTATGMGSRVCLRTLQSTFVLTYPKLHMYALL